MGNASVFELSKSSQKELSGLMDKLLEFCQMNKVPMFCSVAVKNNEEVTEYMNTTYGSKSHIINLTDDQIRKHILVSNGFDAVPARESLTLDMEEVFHLGEDI